MRWWRKFRNRTLPRRYRVRMLHDDLKVEGDWDTYGPSSWVYHFTEFDLDIGFKRQWFITKCIFCYSWNEITRDQYVGSEAATCVGCGYTGVFDHTPLPRTDLIQMGV